MSRLKRRDDPFGGGDLRGWDTISFCQFSLVFLERVILEERMGASETDGDVCHKGY